MSLEETYTEVDETIEGKMRRIEDALHQAQQKGYPCEIVRGSKDVKEKEEHEPNP